MDVVAWARDVAGSETGDAAAGADFLALLILVGKEWGGARELEFGGVSVAGEGVGAGGELYGGESGSDKEERGEDLEDLDHFCDIAVPD